MAGRGFRFAKLPGSENNSSCMHDKCPDLGCPGQEPLSKKHRDTKGAELR